MTNFTDVEAAKRLHWQSWAFKKKINLDIPYDFGDDWEHTIKVEKYYRVKIPWFAICIEGARNCHRKIVDQFLDMKILSKHEK